MPAAERYDPNDRDLRMAAQTERAARQAWLARAWSYYYGDHPKPLKARSNSVDNNVIVNLVKQHADHTISFAAPDFPKIEIDREQQTDAEKWLSDWWTRQGGAVWLSNTMLAGLLSGHVFCRVLPAAPAPRVITLNPGNVLAFWAPDDYESALWYEVYFSRGANRLGRLDIIAPGVLGATDIDRGDGSFIRYAGDRWVISEFEALRRQGDSSTPIEWTRIGSTVWEYDAAPMVDWPHLPKPGAYYGAHELDGIGLNDAVNKVASDIKSILRVYAAPRRVAIGIPASAIKDTAIDSFWTIEGRTPDEVRIDNLEMDSDLGSSMAFLQFLSDAYMQQARVTILSGGPDAYKGVTNLGIKAAFMSQLGKTETIQRQYGRGIARLSVAGAELAGKGAIPEPDTVWPQALPTSEIEAAQTQIMQINAGIQSRTGAAHELGRDYSAVVRQLGLEAVLVDALTSGVLGGGIE